MARAVWCSHCNVFHREDHHGGGTPQYCYSIWLFHRRFYFYLGFQQVGAPVTTQTVLLDKIIALFISLRLLLFGTTYKVDSLGSWSPVVLLVTRDSWCQRSWCSPHSAKLLLGQYYYPSGLGKDFTVTSLQVSFVCIAGFKPVEHISHCCTL